MNEQFSEWIVPAATLIVTWFVANWARWLIARIAKHRHAAIILGIARPLSYFIYVVGLKAFIQSAPFSPKLTLWLDDGVYVFGIWIILWTLQRAAVIAMDRYSSIYSQGFIPLIKNLVTLFIFTMGGIMVLKHFNYDVMSLLTALGVGSLAVGLAAKETLSNMISGFTLIIDRNLKPGDRVNLNGFTGTVEEIGLRSTRIQIGNGNMLIVPNSELVNTKILNLSLPSRAVSCSVSFKVPFDASFAQVKGICTGTFGQVERIRTDKSRWVNLAGLSDGTQTINAGFWISDLDDEGATISEFYEKLVIGLGKAGIQLAKPTQSTI